MDEYEASSEQLTSAQETSAQENENKRSNSLSPSKAATSARSFTKRVSAGGKELWGKLAPKKQPTETEKAPAAKEETDAPDPLAATLPKKQSKKRRGRALTIAGNNAAEEAA